MRLIALPAAFIMVVTTPSVRAGSPQPSPAFDHALVQAYLYNPQLAVARARVRERDEGVPKALSGWRPKVTVDASAGVSAVFDNMDQYHSPERRVPQEENLTLSQPLYTGGRVRAQVGQAEALVQAERAALQATTASVLLAASLAYLDVARDERVLELNRNQEIVLQHTLRGSEQASAAGAVTETDVAQSRARLADQRASVARVLGQLDDSRAQYEQQVGEPPGDLPLSEMELALPPRRDDAIAAADRSNFDIAQARSAQKASEEGIDVAKAGLLPQLSVELRGTRVKETDVQLPHQRDNVAEMALQLTVPLYQGGALGADIRQAKEAANGASLRVDVARRRARALAAAAWDSVQAARARVRQAEISIAANGVAARGIARQQSVGARTLIEVLNAQQELLAAKVNMISARHDELEAGLELLSATGGLTPEALGLPVNPYDPVVHYTATRDRWYGTEIAP